MMYTAELTLQAGWLKKDEKIVFDYRGQGRREAYALAQAIAAMVPAGSQMTVNERFSIVNLYFVAICRQKRCKVNCI